MVKRAGICVCLAVATMAGCGGDADRDGEGRVGKPVDGTFVGKLAGTEAFVAVVASPAVRGGDRRTVEVYVSDGRRLSESLAGSTKGNTFTATAEGRDGQAQGTLSAADVTGTVKLADGKTARYRATRATGPAGLYEIKVSARGRLSGASATGVGVTGVAAAGTGRIKMADGSRRRFEVTGEETERGQVRLIILGGGELRGGGDGRPRLFLRSRS